MSAPQSKPRLAVVLGDPAGIGPELIAKLLSDEHVRARAHIVLIADRMALEDGMRIAGCSFLFRLVSSLDDLRFLDDGVPLLYDYRGDTTGAFPHARANATGGRYCLDTLREAIRLTQAGQTDAVLFGPLNKAALHLAGMAHNDELHWFAELLGHTGPFCEFNVLDNLWTSRVTSHIALKDVPAAITQQGVVDAIGLIHTALLQAGVPQPRIAVCGLNPHNGDNGSFGREELDIIGPAVARANAEGLACEGPFPADTIFLKVQHPEAHGRRRYDAVVTMYHDQGQIAIKLMGFARGVTVQGGLPIPITTPAHGTAFDIAGRGTADVGATRQAFEIACRMGARRRALTDTAAEPLAQS